MTLMANEAIHTPHGRPLTRADLDQLPDDNGHRYELIDGLLVVSPAPSPIHQRAVGNVFLALHGSCPAEYEVFFAPLDVALADDTILQPDLLVARRSDFTDRDLPVAPLLAIEILSPSTRTYDLLLKKERLERAGCQHYWTFDPDTRTMTAWTLHAGTYIQTVTATGDEPFNVDQPYPITLTPSALIAG